MRGGSGRTSRDDDDDINDEATSRQEGGDRPSSSSTSSSSASRLPSKSLIPTAADHSVQSKTTAGLPCQMEDKEEGGHGGTPNLNRGAATAADQWMSTHRAAHSVATSPDENVIERSRSWAGSSSTTSTGIVDGSADGGSDAHDVFEVAFPPTGPLGITFEWAPDPTIWQAVSSQTAAVADISSVLRRTSISVGAASLHARRNEIGSTTKSVVHAGRHRKSDSVGTSPLRGGSSPVIPDAGSPRSTLPPVSTLGSQTFVPSYALRIISFPVLPDEADLCLARTATSVAAVGPDHTPINETQHPASGASYLLECHDISTTRGMHQARRDTITEPKDTGGCAGAVNDQLFCAQTTMKTTMTPTNPEPIGVTPVTGPAAGRDTLRLGDILVEVNGNPVAGPAARHAGVASFQDAVKVVAAAAATTTKANAEERGPRVFKFRRARRPSSSLSATAPPHRPAILPLRGEWVKGMCGAEEKATEKYAEPRAAPGAGHGSTADAVPKSSRRDSYPALPLKGLDRSLDSTGRDGETERSYGGMLAPISPQSITSIGLNSSSDGGSESRRSKKGRGRGRTGADGKVVSVVAAAEHIKAGAR